MTERDKSRSEDLFREFLSRRESGEDIRPEEYFTQYPELEGELRELFSKLDAGEAEEIDLMRESASDSTPKTPQIVGDFRIIREIGKGGMGTVYEAEQASLKRKVALKLLPPHLSFSDEAVQKFRREAEAGGRQSHPGMVAIHAVGEHEGVHFIAQELVEGGRTLADQLEEIRASGKQPSGYFREVAQLIVEIAEALQHAYNAGVIHRDIKPSNILLTRDGTAKVTDFGLAKIEDALALSRTGDFAGTPFYMSPEQAMSKRMGIDHRTDIFSLGVTLYEMLTLTRPFDGETSQEVFKKIVIADPENPHKANPRVPRDLSVICLKAMEKDPARRYQSMQEFGDDLRRFLSGDVILARPAGLRMRFWKRVKRQPIVSTAIGVALIAVVAFAVVVPWVIATKEKEQREAAEAARIEIKRERDRAISAEKIAKDRYEEITRLSDIKRLAELFGNQDSLWPPHPDKIHLLTYDIEIAEDLLTRVELHRQSYEETREMLKTINDWGDTSAHNKRLMELKWKAGLLQEILHGLEILQNGTLKSLRERLAIAQTIEQRSIGDHQQAWDEAIASIADSSECQQYNGLLIEPQLGLVPIGRDPESGLWEFAHLQTGEVPERGEDGKLILTEEMGLVFVLIPGGTFLMGAQRQDPNKPNYDPQAESAEGPIHEVSIQPFLMSKYEMTQGQWLRFTSDNPSQYTPDNIGPELSRAEIPGSLLHPVENLSWDDCVLVLGRMDLRLPSESEWEYAARAGTSTVWWTGNDLASLEGAANTADRYCKEHGGHPSWHYDEVLDDGFMCHAPVGKFRPNAFGIHDVAGNLFEWCWDSYGPYTRTTLADGSASELSVSSSRVLRGGGWNDSSRPCRSATRSWIGPGIRNYDIGVRPARSITTE